MKAIVLYRPNSEHARAVEEYIREFQRRTGRNLELLDVDTKEGANMVELYDAVRYPAVIAIADDGRMLSSWLGEPLPLINDVDGYLVK